MADALHGVGGSWIFEAGAVRMRYERTMKVSKLLQELGERLVPYSALAAATLSAGKKGTVVLQLTPRVGADPVMVAAAGQLREQQNPYRLVLPVVRETLAEYYRDEIRSAIQETGPCDRLLVAGPEAPLAFKGWDGQAAFDGRTVRLQWFWSGATYRKYKAGDQTFDIGEIEGVEWRSPDVFDGHLRLRLREGGAAEAPDKDPASVVFGMGTGLTHESLPFAAAVVAAIEDAPVPVVAPSEEAQLPSLDGHSPTSAADRIRQLAALRDEGLITEEEFQSKKAQLLTEL